MEKAFITELQSICGEERVLCQEPLAKHTTFRIGGPAAALAQPSGEEELSSLLALCARENVPYFLLGNGSNLLVSDLGYEGLVIQLFRNQQEIFVSDSEIRAQAGALLSRLAGEARNASLTGLEFAGGIPGTVGGAVVMNAGAYGGEIRQVLVRARTMLPDGRILDVPAEDLELGYRHSRIDRTGEIVLEAAFCLAPGDRDQISGRMRDLARERQAKQPLESPSAGSTFKRPEGHFAGKLIMDCGLRGYRVGGAMVSEKHCGFVINAGGATAGDVYCLIQDVRRMVQDQTGVLLEPEVRFLGDFHSKRSGL